LPKEGLKFSSICGILVADRFTTGGTERSTDAYLDFFPNQTSGTGAIMFLVYIDDPGEP